MLKAMIIADDLTGAADTGVKFAACGPVELINSSYLPQASISQAEGAVQTPGLWGLAVATETRNAPAGEVPAALARAASLGGEKRPDLIYKKIDSCLRGHVGLELDYLLENLSYRAALVAPAYPIFKRVTKNGLHYIDGCPVSETELARDPIRPVRDSRLARVIAEGHQLPVHSLSLDLIRSGSEAVGAEVERLLQSEKRCLFALDAESDADLDTVAEAGLKARDRLILAGSAGLAEALARRLTAGAPAARPIRRRPGPIVFFGGSASETLRNQLQRLAQDWRAAVVTLDPADLLAGRFQEPPALEDGQTLVVNLPRPAPEAAWSSLELIAAFGRRSADIIRRLKPAAVFLSGGDTARAVLEALGISRLRIEAEIRPGVVLLSHREMAVLTKSGTFGDEALLSEVRRLLN